MTEHNVHLICPNLQCRKLLLVHADLRGHWTRCAHCKIKIKVPTARIRTVEVLDEKGAGNE